MKKFYCLGHCLKRSCIEILPNRKIEGDFLHTYLKADLPSTKERLPESLVFHIKACKKEFDIIGTYNCWTVVFYSKELMSILNQFTDMSDRSYKINLPDATKEYYAIYNLKKYKLINRKEIDLGDVFYPDYHPLRFVFGKKDLGPVFSIDTTAEIIVSEEIMEAIKKAKLTNIKFKEAYGYTPEEALEWALENPEYSNKLPERKWFQKYLEQ